MAGGKGAWRAAARSVRRRAPALRRHKKNKPNHDCSQVADKHTESRCDKWEDAEGVLASKACLRACGTCSRFA